MPLNRQEGTAPAAIPTAVNAQPNAPEASTVETPAHAQSSIIPPIASEATSLPPTEPSAGPTDERGSPLFVPTVPADSQPTQPEIQSPTPTRTQNPDNTSASPSAEPTNTPWTSGSWGFNEQIPTEPAQSNTGSATETNVEEDSSDTYAGKGKGKAVEVEDASDPEA
jgi:E3 ubiquitin-protein ligase synoviolin